jgi:hypothetical protein
MTGTERMRATEDPEGRPHGTNVPGPAPQEKAGETLGRFQLNRLSMTGEI